MSKKIKITAIIILVVVLAIAGYFGWKFFNKNEEVPENTNSFSAATTITPEKTPASSWKLYKNSDFGFEIQYLATWIVSEENIINVRGENTKAIYFKKPNSDLRFAILPRDGLSYGLPENGTSSEVFIGGFLGAQTKYTMNDGRRLWLIHPQYGLYNWAQDIGRIDILSSVTDPVGDTTIFEKMLNSFKLSK